MQTICIEYCLISVDVRTFHWDWLILVYCTEYKAIESVINAVRILVAWFSFIENTATTTATTTHSQQTRQWAKQTADGIVSGIIWLCRLPWYWTYCFFVVVVVLRFLFTSNDKTGKKFPKYRQWHWSSIYIEEFDARTHARKDRERLKLAWTRIHNIACYSILS